MSQLVVTMTSGAPPHARAALDRLRDAWASRVGNGREIRTNNSRSADTAFATFVAAKARVSAVAVVRHVCRHDEGISDCSSATKVVG